MALLNTVDDGQEAPESVIEHNLPMAQKEKQTITKTCLYNFDPLNPTFM